MEKKQYGQTGWGLTELLPEFNEREVNKAFAGLEEKTAALESVRPKLSDEISPGVFRALLKAIEDFAEAAHRIGAYGGLRFSENTQDHEALAFMGKAEQLLTEAHNRVLFIELWWRGLGEEAAGRLMAGAGDLGYYLFRQRLFKPHTLTEPEEKIVSLKDVNGANALNTLYDMITNKFAFEFEVEGEKKSLNREELTQYARDPSAGLREAAYRELYRVYGGEATVLGQIYMSRVRDWKSENMGLRGFGSPIAVRNLSNDLPDGVVDTLLEVCEEEAGVFHRYFRLKAGWLGLAKLRRFDLYAPVGTKAARKIPYPDAVDMVLEGLERFSPEVCRMARLIFEQGHIDSELRPGKRGGAFCMSVTPGLAPWVLTNYTGEPRQVATLAHELGHAVHSLMAGEHSVLTFHAPLPLAETASVFSEMLLTDHLLSLEKDAEARREIMAETIDNIYATVLRQAFFVLFEREAHRMAAEGSTIEELHAAYLENLGRQFGGSVDIDGVFRHEWVSIPHIFHTPFYCYAYSFGMLLSLSLYQRFREQGEEFKPSFFRILAHGGSQRPARILAEAGIDVAEREFWRGGFRVIEGMVKELDAAV
jgi:oligoendopeptidase F